MYDYLKFGLGLAFVFFATGCEEASVDQALPPDCSWSQACVKRVVKTTHFDENTVTVDVTYYDKEERLIQRINDFGSEYSSGAIQYRYNNHGDVVQERFLDKDGRLESLLKYVYDDKSRLIKQLGEYYLPEEGNATVTYQYNDRNHTMIKQTDNDNDGKFEAIAYYTFDASWHKIATEIDTDGDGFIELMWRFDDHGKEIEYHADWDDDNIMEVVTHSQAEYDEQGRLIVSRYDEDNDGIFEHTTAYKYDPEGRIANVTSGGESTAYRYDEYGRLMEVKEESADGSCRIEKAHYIDANDTMEILSDYEGDGTVDDRIWCHWQMDSYDNAHRKPPSYLTGRTWAGRGCLTWPLRQGIEPEEEKFDSDEK